VLLTAIVRILMMEAEATTDVAAPSHTMMAIPMLSARAGAPQVNTALLTAMMPL